MRTRFCLLTLVLLPVALSAQVVVGTARDDLGQPVQGALATLFDSTGGEVTRNVTDATGAFRLEAGRRATFYVKLLRVGFAPWISEPFSIESAEHILSATVEPIRTMLPPITREVRDRCEERPTDGAATAALWEAASTALAINRQTIRDRLYRFRTRMVERSTDINGRPQGQAVQLFTRVSSWPFQSVELETLARRGFVQSDPGGPIYYGPDTEVLFSDFFLEQHCWGVAERDELVGLTFTPARDRRVPDLEGVLWLERETLELQTLEFEYTSLESWVPEGSAWGRYDFMKLPNNAWILSGWMLRAPRARIEPNIIRVDSYQIREGRVTEVRTVDGEVVFALEVPEPD